MFSLFFFFLNKTPVLTLSFKYVVKPSYWPRWSDRRDALGGAETRPYSDATLALFLLFDFYYTRFVFCAVVVHCILSLLNIKMTISSRHVFLLEKTSPLLNGLEWRICQSSYIVSIISTSDRLKIPGE